MKSPALFIHYLLTLCVYTCVYFLGGADALLMKDLMYFLLYIKYVILFVGGHLALFYGK